MTEPLLAIEGLRIVADGSGAVLLQGLDLTLGRGERLAIVGESGSGKTMATRTIPRLLAAGVHRESGSIRFDGRELTGLVGSDLRRIPIALP